LTALLLSGLPILLPLSAPPTPKVLLLPLLVSTPTTPKVLPALLFHSALPILPPCLLSYRRLALSILTSHILPPRLLPNRFLTSGIALLSLLPPRILSPSILPHGIPPPDDPGAINNRRLRPPRRFPQ
jgi:hypothetical protein